jgi:uncharacterized damage-inducible protein DinB
MDLVRLLAYDHWANRETARVLRQAAPPQAASVFAHLVAINELWLTRVVGGEVGSAWPNWSLNLATDRLDIAFENWSPILGGLGIGDSIRTFNYRNSMGEECTSSYVEVALELFSHGAHHRGQIALLLRQAGIEPPSSTDFIPALREARF